MNLLQHPGSVEVDGSLIVPGVVAPATPGDTRFVLNLQHDGGSTFFSLDEAIVWDVLQRPEGPS